MSGHEVTCPPPRGRFAPSPTGPLHPGSLVTAVASYLDAKSRPEGEWIVRIEDLDTARSMPGAASAILRSLEAHGLAWDGPVVTQSERTALYRETLDRIGPVAYPCACSRRDSGARYPGTCRAGIGLGRTARVWRVRVPPEPIVFEDRMLGSAAENLEETCGDFVVLRADGLFAYQLAVAADDIDQGVTDVVRGRDLLDSTARQVYLYRLLKVPVPSYLHVPLVCNETGEKLSKQTLAPALDGSKPGDNLWKALEFLKQDPPRALYGAPAAELVTWGLKNWRVSPGMWY